LVWKHLNLIDLYPNPLFKFEKKFRIPYISILDSCPKLQATQPISIFLLDFYSKIGLPTSSIQLPTLIPNLSHAQDVVVLANTVVPCATVDHPPAHATSQTEAPLPALHFPHPLAPPHFLFSLYNFVTNEVTFHRCRPLLLPRSVASRCPNSI
jgi:hypothetical protein